MKKIKQQFISMRTTTLMHFASIFALSLLCVFSISCDDKELSPEERAKQETQKDITDMTFWNVAGQLSNGCEQVDDWKSVRLEANIGQPSQQSDATRLVLVNDADAALERFAALIGTELPSYTVSYDWTLNGAGSLTYRKQTDGTAWATVDVDLKQFPGLKRIVYCAPDQQGLNRDFAGTAYYRFGDVIKKKNDDGNWDYWICVRPAFGKEGKQDTHWVTFSPLPEKNILKYVASTKDAYYLPTKLSGAYSKIHWQNAAEMLFAILRPEKWRDNLDNNPKLSFFNDFSRNRIQYHNKYFWMRVQKAWQEHDLFKQLLHYDYKHLTDSMQSVRFIYYGYSWKWTWSWDLTLWAQEYSGMDNNFHTFKALEKTENVKNKVVDVRQYGNFGEHPDGYAFFPKFSYPCRYATGKDLAGFKPNEYSTIANRENGIVEVYRYNKEYGIDHGPGTEPEVCIDINGGAGVPSDLAHGYFKPGTIIRDSEGTRWLCYLHWINEPDMGPLCVGGGQKARFISFEDIVSNAENIDNDAYYGFFAKNLIPEKEVPKLAYCLWQFAFQEKSAAEIEFRANVEEKMGVKLTDLFAHRDTTFWSGKSSGKASIYATNFLYEPDGGRKTGTQPYMRYVMDGSHVGTNRGDLPKDQQYWMHQFFKKTNSQSNQRPLDLVDLFKAYGHLAKVTIPADKWSSCKRHGTDYRDSAFTNDSCYDDGVYSADYFKYNTLTASWRTTVSDNGFTRPKYVSVYREPVIVAKYMELEDTKEEFQETYKTGDGRTEKFTKVYEPSLNAAMQVYITYWATLYNTAGLVWMDNVPFNMTSK